MSSDATSASGICPICHGDNLCAFSKGSAPEDCWCRAKVIDTSILATIPPELAGKTCICPECAKRQGAPDSE